MSSRTRVLLCSTAFVLAFGLARIDLAGREAPPFAQFGGAVLVGDGEVFAGESQNQFRPGLVYVFRKTGASWVEAATIASPKSAVGDGFGSSLALDGSTLFVGAGATADPRVHKAGRELDVRVHGGRDCRADAARSSSAGARGATSRRRAGCGCGTAGAARRAVRRRDCRVW